MVGSGVGFRVLGPIQVVDATGAGIELGGAKRRALLARLLIDANAVVAAERLVEDLWEGNPPPGASATLQSHVSQLRRRIGPDRLRTVQGGYVLDVADDELDARTFEGEVAEGRELVSAGRPADALVVLEPALARWRGPSYGGVRDAGWALAEATRLDELRVQAVEMVLGARLALGQHAGVVAGAEKAIAAEPLRERLWAMLITGLYRDGRQAHALRAYQRLRETLAEELGIDPSPELQALEQKVLLQDAGLAGAVPVAPAEPPVPSDRAATLPTGLVTFLLSDVAGSTRMWETAPDVMPGALRRHDDVIAEAVTTNRGVVLKARGEGDSTFSVFWRATDAVAAALAAQAKLEAQEWPPQCSIRVRMGVHTGEAIERDGDYYGRAVNRVARLRGIADAGQILLSRAVADVVVDHLAPDVEIVDLGVRRLRDLDRPETVYAVHRTGAAVAPAPPPTDERSPRRKTVTVVFADLEESAGVDERLDPEAGRALLGQYHVAMRAEVEARGGRVVKADTDGMLGVFGVPGVAEDDALRALLAADALVATCEKLGAEARTRHGVPLVLRVAVTTGEVVVEADDTDVVGDAVTLASRLTLAAAPDDVLVDETTRRLTRHAAGFEPTPPLQLRGRASTVTAHRLVAAIGSPDTTPTPFVGRNAELASLVGLFDAAVEQNSCRLAIVLGSPGVGKTRLVREVDSSLAARATVLAARCDPAGGATFAPIADVLSDVGPLEDLLGSDPERDRVVSGVNGLTGAGPAGTPEETFWAVRRLVEAAARDRPVLLVLDDLQWAEPLLLDLVEHLAEWITEHPVLIIAVARPELRELRPSLTEARGRASTLVALEGLDRNGTEQLACGLLGTDHAPDALLARLVPSTDGNPLFVRELVRMLIDDGVLHRDGDEWTLMVDASLVEVPPTIQALLAARIDRLRPEERIVLERAAVIGSELYRGALDELVPAELRGQLDALLEALRRKELLEPAGTYWIDERVLRFHHVLIRDAAYRRLLREARAGLHEQVAAWLVNKTGGSVDHDEIIGYHLEQAQANRRRLGPLDEHGRQVAAEAVERLASAARRALDRDDLLAAASLADRAIACLDFEDPGRAELLLTRCEALLGEGDVAVAETAIDELARHATGDPRLEAWTTCFAVQRTSLVDPRDLGDAEPQIVEAAARLAGLGDAGGAAEAHRVHAMVLGRLGRVGDCEAALDRALSAAREAKNRRQVTGVLNAAPVAALWGPSPVPRAGGRCLDVIRLVRITTGAAAVEVTSIRCQAVLEAFRGRLDAARTMLATARATAEDLGLRHGLLEIDLSAGIVELCGGDASAAGDHLRRAQEGFKAMGVQTDAAQAAALRGRAALIVGDHDEALACAAESEQLGGQDLKTAIAWRTVRAEVLAHRGAIDEAKALAEAAVALAERTDALIDHADACTALAAVRRAAGDLAGANAATEQARALYERKGATALLARIADPLTAGAVLRATPARPPTAAGNTASDALERVFHLQATAQFDALSSMLAPDLVNDDRRPGMASHIEGRDAVMDQFRVIAGLGVKRIPSEVVAVRGDRLALVRSLWQGEAFETAVLTVVRLDREDRPQLAVTFDIGDLVSAVMELDDLYRAGEGASEPACAATAAATAAYNAREWDRLAALYANEVVAVDHRLASFGETRGVVQLIARQQEVVDVVPGFVSFVERYLATDDTTTLAELGQRAEVGGGPYELARYLVTKLRAPDGPIERLEYFGADQLGAAASRYRELSNSERLENAAARQYWRAFEFALAGRFDEIRDLTSSAYALFDRRSGLGARVDGKDGAVDNLRTSIELGVRRVDAEVVATRGERLSLISGRYFGDQFEAEILVVNGIDEAGRDELAVMFDPADLAAALVELDERYAAGEGAAYAANVAFAAMSAAHNERDWARFAAVLGGSVVVVDHRLASFGESRGAAALIEHQKYEVEQMPDDLGFVRRFLACDELTTLAELGQRATGPGGGAYEMARYVVVKLRSHDGPMERMEYFDAGQLELARARYCELSIPNRLANAATRQAERVVDRVLSGRFDTVASLMAPDVVTMDRRAGLGGRVAGRAAVVDQWVAAGKLWYGARVEATVIAIRGERLSLSRFVFDFGDYEVELLMLNSVDEGGRGQLAVVFDVSDLAAALVELDEQYAAGEGSAHASMLTMLVKTTTAYNDQAWDRLREIYDDEILAVDHRPAGYGEIRGADLLIERHKTMLELAPDYVIVVSRILAFDDLGMLAETTAVATGAGGGSDDMPRLILTRLHTPEGPVERFEYFSPDQLDEAWARYRQLAAANPLENEASRHYRQVCELLRIGRWEDVGSMLSPGDIEIDRRSGLSHRIEGRDEVVEQFRIVAAGQALRFDTDVVAIRGDRLALVRTLYVGTGFEVDVLVVVGLDDEGQREFAVLFDANDLALALAELDARYRSSREAPRSAALRSDCDLSAAYNARDWRGMRQLYAEDLVWFDHRPASYGETRGVAEVFERGRVMVDVTPNFVNVTRRYLAIDDLVTLAESMAVGGGAVGGHYEIARLVLTKVRASAGVVERLEMFAPGQLDAAMARFHELSAPVVPANAAVRHYQRVAELLASGHPEDIRSILSADAVIDDRRAGMRNLIEGREGVVEAFMAGARVGATRIDVDVIAARGERLALLRALYAGDRFEVEYLTIIGLDEAGAGQLAVDFDVGDMTAALAELDAWYAAGEGAAHEAVISVHTEFERALNDRDATSMRSLLAHGFVLIDHRPAGWGTLDADGAVRHLLGLDELVTARRTFTQQIHALGDSGLVLAVVTTGTAPTGGPFEFPLLSVTMIADEQINRIEPFPAEAVDDALARFDELCRHGRPPTVVPSPPGQVGTD